jgi:hypothetical protein
MAKSRKRLPGGGRKPKGGIRGKIENFSTRITADTRKALEAEARMTGQSISQVAERLLMLGIRAKRERERDKPMRALNYLIDNLAIIVSASKIGSPAGNWRTEPIVFESLRLAIDGLMKQLSPPGDIKPSANLMPPTDPQERADIAVRIIVANLDAARQSPSDLFEGYPEIKAALDMTLYQYQHAARDLAIKEGGK